MAQHGIAHQGVQSEADLGLAIRILQLPNPEGCEKHICTTIQENILDMVIRLTIEPQKQWQLETIVANCPLKNLSFGAERNDARHLLYKYKYLESDRSLNVDGEEVVSVVKDILDDWCSICKLYGKVLELQDYLKGTVEQYVRVIGGRRLFTKFRKMSHYPSFHPFKKLIEINLNKTDIVVK